MDTFKLIPRAASTPSGAFRLHLMHLVLCAAAAASGCAEPPDPRTAAGLDWPVRYVTECVQTTCDTCEEGAASLEGACSECLGICARLSDPSCIAQCSGFCSATPSCDATCRAEPVCAAYEGRFELVGAPDDDVQRACVTYAAHAISCGVAVPDVEANCRRFAATEDPQRASAAFACLSSAPCGSAAAACAPRPVHGLVAWYCEAIGRSGQACDEATVEWLEAADGWLSDGAAAALRGCAEGRTMNPNDACVAAFRTQVASWR